MNTNLTLKAYMDLRDITVPEMAKELGRKRQNVDQWIEKEATVVILPDGRIKVSTEKVVHRPQVDS